MNKKLLPVGVVTAALVVQSVLLEDRQTTLVPQPQTHADLKVPTATTTQAMSASGGAEPATGFLIRQIS
jgi:hypothetical protein